jgi:HK97 family phage prohead protease
MDERETKFITLKELGAQGELSAIVSTFNQLDRDGDIMAPESFASSRGKKVPLVWSHDWDHPVGAGTIEVTSSEAIFNGQFFLDTQRGEEAYKTVKAMAELQQYSIGFRVLDQIWEYKDDGKGSQMYVRTIRDLELFECSPVLVGAAYGTRTLAVKGIESKAEWDAAYINNLPDSAFAIVLPGGEKDDEGKTVPRDLRKLPHHSAEGTVDVPHLRNALSREPQADLTEAQHARAKAHLQRHAEAEGVGTDSAGKALATILVELDHLEEQKAGATLSEANLTKLHTILSAAMALHDASNCDGGEGCPMVGMKASKPDDDDDDDDDGFSVKDERKAQLRKLQSVLGFRPLTAGAAKLD